MSEHTPAMQQYINLKKENPDCILFFRVWDFYETFFEDAEITSKNLDLLLTSKNKKSDNPIPMAWIPHHSSEKYIQKLIDKWFKVAIAEQTTQPQPWKIVEREVVEIYTPWTYIQNSANKFNYLLSISIRNNKNWEKYHIARWDFSIWEYTTKSFVKPEDLQNFISVIQPTEIIFDIENLDHKSILNPIKQTQNTLCSFFETPTNTEIFITEYCEIQTISTFGKALLSGRIFAFGLLLNYIKNTKKQKYTIVKITHHENSNNVIFDNTSIKNLEIFVSNYELNEKQSLFWVINNCKTSIWSRILRHILTNPTQNTETINFRLNQIEKYLSEYENTKSINKIIWQIWDINKIISNILYRKPHPYNFLKLRKSIDLLVNNSFLIIEIKRLWFKEQNRDKIVRIYTDLLNAIKNDEEITWEINFIKDWYNEEIDKTKNIVFNSDKLLIQYQQELSQFLWLPNIKIKYIKNQWYFIEATNKDNKEIEKKINELYEKFGLIRSSSLKWAQRYSANFLENIEQEIILSREKLAEQELEILNIIRKRIESEIKYFNELSDKIWWLDIFTSNAILSKEKNYCKPKFINKNWIYIEDWRHPVIEEFLPKEDKFIANSLKIWENSDWEIQIITWPNMWWKSTYLRQNAIIILLSHCWLFVPAKKAIMQVSDWIFARIWSWDIIAKNQSTFMTEMIEVANILNNSSKNSFIIFDELWRWTSTYDWLAITKAILEHIDQNIWAKTLIATHYHELINLSKTSERITNYSVSVYENEKDVVFMKKIVAGWASKSYWIDVAKLAWINSSIIQNARTNLQELETQKNKQLTKPLFLVDEKKGSQNIQLEKIKNILKSFEINNITPIQAIQILETIKIHLK